MNKHYAIRKIKNTKRRMTGKPKMSKHLLKISKIPPIPSQISIIGFLVLLNSGTSKTTTNRRTVTEALTSTFEMKVI